jgi:hypothetical protein
MAPHPGDEAQASLPQDDGHMEAGRAFCAHSNRDVIVLVSRKRAHEGMRGHSGAEVVCLEIGGGCTGASCPITSVPPAAMAARIAQQGIRLPTHAEIRTACSSCDRMTTHTVIDDRFISCRACGTTITISV